VPHAQQRGMHRFPRLVVRQCMTMCSGHSCRFARPSGQHRDLVALGGGQSNGSSTSASGLGSSSFFVLQLLHFASPRYEPCNLAGCSDLTGVSCVFQRSRKCAQDKGRSARGTDPALARTSRARIHAARFRSGDSNARPSVHSDPVVRLGELPSLRERLREVVTWRPSSFRPLPQRCSATCSSR